MLPKYKCKKCGFVYDSQKGDAKNNIKPGTIMDNLPNDWRCPICNADKSFFIKGGV